MLIKVTNNKQIRTKNNWDPELFFYFVSNWFTRERVDDDFELIILYLGYENDTHNMLYDNKIIKMDSRTYDIFQRYTKHEILFK